MGGRRRSFTQRRRSLTPRRRSFTPRRRSLIPEDFSVSPSPLGTDWAFELGLIGLGLGLGGLGTKGLGLGLDNLEILEFPKSQLVSAITSFNFLSLKSKFSK